jgi:mannose-6-phosphate isomerase-like protein (cupin superfamily)
MAYSGQTLENPASGERITIRRTAAETNGELLAIDLELPANRRVPGGQHIHPLQEERFEVVSGSMRFKMGRKRVVAGAGEVVAVPPGQKHDFANVGDDEALVRVEVRPALKMEQLFETAVGLAEEGRTMLGGIPRPLDLALFTEEFEDAVQGAFPPRWIQRMVLKPLAWIARRRGTSLRPPEPVTVSWRPALGFAPRRRSDRYSSSANEPKVGSPAGVYTWMPTPVLVVLWSARLSAAGLAPSANRRLPAPSTTG